MSARLDFVVDYCTTWMAQAYIYTSRMSLLFPVSRKLEYLLPSQGLCLVPCALTDEGKRIERR